MSKIATAAETGRALIAECLIQGGPGDADKLELAAVLCRNAPAMVTALRNLIPLAVEAIAERACSDDSADLELLPEYRRDLQEARAILSRIDGAGDTLPDAPAPAPTVSARDDLPALLSDVSGFLAGFDGCEFNGEAVESLQARIAAFQGEA